MQHCNHKKEEIDTIWFIKEVCIENKKKTPRNVSWTKKKQTNTNMTFECPEEVKTPKGPSETSSSSFSTSFSSCSCSCSSCASSSSSSSSSCSFSYVSSSAKGQITAESVAKVETEKLNTAEEEEEYVYEPLPHFVHDGIEDVKETDLEYFEQARAAWPRFAVLFKQQQIFEYILYPTKYVEIFTYRLIQELPGLLRLEPHPNVIAICGVLSTKERIVSFSPWFGTHLSKIMKTLSHKTKLHILTQVCDGLQHLHRNNIVHHDVCPENISVNQFFEVKLTEFGLGRNFQRSLWPPDFHVHYQAPETLLYHDQLLPPADIFAFGGLLIAMFTDWLPWSKPLDEYSYPSRHYSSQQVRQLVEGKHMPPELLFISFDPIQKLAMDCLAFDPSTRPSIDVVKDRLMQISQMEYCKSVEIHNIVDNTYCLDHQRQSHITDSTCPDIKCAVSRVCKKTPWFFRPCLQVDPFVV